MTLEEFSTEFDVLYNSITSNQAPGIDEYEKSVFLTKAQEEVLLSYFDPRSNKVQEGFDGSERRQIDFSSVMKSVVYAEAEDTDTEDTDTEGIDEDEESKDAFSFSEGVFDLRENTKSVTMEDDILVLVNEYVEVTRNNTQSVRLIVVPIHYQEYSRLMSKPFKRPLKYQAWRLIDNVNGAKRSELIIGPGDVLTKYVIRYVKRPLPIIVGELDGLKVNNKTYDDVSGIGCELDPILHREVLQRAVELAKAAYTGDINSLLAVGNQSATDIGVVPQTNSRER